MIKVRLIDRIQYALFGYFTVNAKCPHGKFIEGTYQTGRSTKWGCPDCPMTFDIKWHKGDLI